jgi:hypothetical protein
MTKLEITDNLLQRLIGEVAPHVERAIGWDLNLASLNARALPKNQAYEEIVLGRLRKLGNEGDEAARRGLVERLVEYVFEGSIQAAYQPNDGEILVVRENVDDSNLDGLRLTLAHELVHRGQHIAHPELFAKIENQLHAINPATIEKPDPDQLQAVLDALEEIRPIMVLLESHAFYIQGQLAANVYPQGRIEEQRSLPVYLFRLFGGYKLSQYHEGLPAISNAAQNGNVNELYHSFR